MSNILTSMWVGVSGLKVNQSALNTAGHNLANLDTTGYVRQQILAADHTYNNIGSSYYNTTQVGLGTDMAAIRQVRDSFLDKAYRVEAGRKSFYDSQLEAVLEMEDLFGEMQGEKFQDGLLDLWTSLQELQKEPDSNTKRKLLVETSVSFLERAENLKNQLDKYQVSLNEKVLKEVKEINSIGHQLVELNEAIRVKEAGGENANDYRDARNQLLDELGEKVNMTYKEDINGVVTVNVEGAQFVSYDSVNEMKVEKVSEDSSMLKVVWANGGLGDVFDLDNAYTTAQNTDIGSLKGILTARGEDAADYTDIPLRENYTSDKAYQNAIREFNNKVNPSVIMSIQAQFDQLIHGIVTKLNDILSPNAGVNDYLNNLNLKTDAGTDITVTANGVTYTVNTGTGDAHAVSPLGAASTGVPRVRESVPVSAFSNTAGNITYTAGGKDYSIDKAAQTVTITDAAAGTAITLNGVYDAAENTFTYTDGGKDFTVDGDGSRVTAELDGPNTTTFRDRTGLVFEINRDAPPPVFKVSREDGTVLEKDGAVDATTPGVYTFTYDGKTYTVTDDPADPDKASVQMEYDLSADQDEFLLWDEGVSPEGMDEPNHTSREVLFNRKNMDRYTKAEMTMTVDGAPVTRTVYIYNQEDPESANSLFTLGQIEVNPEIKKDETKIPLTGNSYTGKEGAYDITICNKLIEVWGEDFATLDPNTLTPNNFMEYYEAMIGALGNRGKVMDSISTNQQKLIEQIDNGRQGVMGVSADEELTNLIKFQHAYNASAKYISAIDEMLRHIIEKLG